MSKWGNQYEDDVMEYFEARREHAWLLRSEGLTYREIGDRLGVCLERSFQMVLKHEEGRML